MNATAHRILAVDDNAMNLKLVVTLLAHRGYNLRTAVSAVEALDVVRAFRPHLILLDLQLPDIDGLELTRRLKASPETSGIIIVAVTAYAMKGDEQKALAAGVDGYITKPIDAERFYATISSCLAERGPEQTREGRP
jgi:CheY-like chemotaxis protein